jgi:hypothetical protein
MQASRQWATRPADQRFTSLTALHNQMVAIRDNSQSDVISSRRIEVMPHPADPRGGITIQTEHGMADPTNWAFGQLAALAGAPSSYLKTLPAPIVADCMNYGLRFKRDSSDVGLLRTRMSVAHPDMNNVSMAQNMAELRAATGPQYGRIWNAEITHALTQKFGDGRTGDFRIPGEFGKAVDITKDNTTIYGSDRDIFVFLADEENRVEMPNRRNGQSGSLARGFFVWNSEVGSATMGAAFFLFDYACSNRIVWGAEGYKEIRLRHTRNAPDRWMEEITPVLQSYAHEAAAPIEQTIAAAQAKKLDDDLDAFLAKRFSGSDKLPVSTVAAISDAHFREEGRPIETLWDLTTGITAYAKTIPHQDARVQMERKGGKILDLAAA